MGDTWGISGPTFLFCYLVLDVAVLVAAMWSRRSLARAGGSEPERAIEHRPHDVAYLNGGPDLAVLSALTALRLRGAISSNSGTVHAVPHSDRTTDELECAVYGAVRPATDRHSINAFVGYALDAADERLVETGLLLSTAQQQRLRTRGWWMVAVVGLGLLRLIAAVSEGEPIGFLFPLMLAAAAAAVILAARVPRRTHRGDRTLRALRIRYHALAPTMRDDWVLDDGVLDEAAGAALGIGLFGTGALWATHPVIAGELAVQRTDSGNG